MNSAILIGVFCGGVLILLFLGIGIYLIIRSNKDKQKAQSSQQWPSVMGRIVASEVRESSSMDSEGDTSTMYKPYVQYEYNVMGSPFTGEKVSIGLTVSHGSPSQPREIVAKYPVGASVPVYYNPENPADAVLEQRSGSSKVSLILGIVFIVIAICGGCSALVALIFQFINS